MAWIKKDDKVGFIDARGELVILPKFNQAQPFKENLAAVRLDNRWGFIDREGSLLIPAQFYQVAPFSEGLSRIEATPVELFSPRKFGFIDRTGKTVIEPQFDWAEPFSSGLAYVGIYSANSLGSQTGYITPTGQWVMQDIPGAGASFSEGLAARRVQRPVDPLQPFNLEYDYGYANPQGQWVISPQMLSSQSGLTSIQQAGPFQSGICGD
ncbi:MAG: WG repeat-containing protein [Synechococcales cyanobacterium RM1_1_8]|nr:WG repeat-containing protein [Synechococcales cyanobacterium RM1_1_8]